MIGTRLGALGRSQTVKFFVAKIKKDDLELLRELLETGKVKSVDRQALRAEPRRPTLSATWARATPAGRSLSPCERRRRPPARPDPGARRGREPDRRHRRGRAPLRAAARGGGLEVELLDERVPGDADRGRAAERRRARPDRRPQRPPRHGADPARAPAGRRRHDLRARHGGHEGRARLRGRGGARRSPSGVVPGRARDRRHRSARVAARARPGPDVPARGARLHGRLRRRRRARRPDAAGRARRLRDVRDHDPPRRHGHARAEDGRRHAASDPRRRQGDRGDPRAQRGAGGGRARVGRPRVVLPRRGARRRLLQPPPGRVPARRHAPLGAGEHVRAGGGRVPGAARADRGGVRLRDRPRPAARARGVPDRPRAPARRRAPRGVPRRHRARAAARPA